MESRPQNPEFMNNPENFHPCLNTLPGGLFMAILRKLLPLITSTDNLPVVPL